MADQRKGGIAWTDQTWNPIRGCTRVSAGCENCYAEAMAARFCGAGQPYEGTINPETKRWNSMVRLVPEKLEEPLHWTRPRRIFVNSMSDLFHPSVPDEYIDKVFAVMALCPQHTFQVLTKRPDRMLAYMTDGGRPRRIGGNTGWMNDSGIVSPWPLTNVWLGVTVENQEAADERIPLLLKTPAAVRWVSCEPLVGPVSFRWMAGIFPEPYTAQNPSGKTNHLEALRRIDWVVSGGESGPHARPMHPDWARSLRDQCVDAGVPFMFKQWGEFETAYHKMGGDSVFRQFSSFEQWVNKASTWVNGGVCLDTAGNELKIGADFMRARDEGKFPVTIMHRVGTKAAGRLLDGVLHDEYPVTQP